LSEAQSLPRLALSINAGFDDCNSDDVRRSRIFRCVQKSARAAYRP
jgi:hypothetical protein